MSRISSSSLDSRLQATPRWVLGSTLALLMLGAAASSAWWRTGDPAWIDNYFHYLGAIFFIACSLLAAGLSYLVWRQFSSGDSLRPAWLLIALSAFCQLVGGLASHILGAPSRMNPLFYLPTESSRFLMHQALEIGRLFSPIYMALLACGLLLVLRVCRRNGVLGNLKLMDLFLLGPVIVYSVYYVATVVLSPVPLEGSIYVKILAWTSDPLLSVLLLEAILVRRSVANLGWGLIARCWAAFTAAIFLTSLGDMGLWASANGYLPYALEIVSWHVWFVASAAFALGPVYQLQAMLHATRGFAFDEVGEPLPALGPESAASGA